MPMREVVSVERWRALTRYTRSTAGSAITSTRSSGASGMRAAPWCRLERRLRLRRAGARPWLKGRGSRPRALEDEFREEPDPDRRRALGLVGSLAVGVSRARDIEVHPGIAFHELAQEPSARDRSGAAATGVFHVRDVGLEELPIFVPQWQRPDTLPCAFSRIPHLGEQRLVVPHRAHGHLAERHDHGAGERGDVDYRGGLEAPDVRQRIAQDEAPLGVGVDDLDRLAQVALHDVAWLDGGAGREVLGRGDDAHDVELGLEAAQRLERAEHGGRARHVELHVLHVLRWLDGNTAGVERDALADERDRCRVSPASPASPASPPAVFEHDEAGLLLAAL